MFLAGRLLCSSWSAIPTPASTVTSCCCLASSSSGFATEKYASSSFVFFWGPVFPLGSFRFFIPMIMFYDDIFWIVYPFSSGNWHANILKTSLVFFFLFVFSINESLDLFWFPLSISVFLVCFLIFDCIQWEMWLIFPIISWNLSHWTLDFSLHANIFWDNFLFFVPILCYPFYYFMAHSHSLRTTNIWSFAVLLHCLYSSESLCSCFVCVNLTTVIEAFLKSWHSFVICFYLRKKQWKSWEVLGGSESGQLVSITAGCWTGVLTCWVLFPNVVICISGAISFSKDKKKVQISCLRAASSKQNSTRVWVFRWECQHLVFGLSLNPLHGALFRPLSLCPVYPGQEALSFNFIQNPLGLSWHGEEDSFGGSGRGSHLAGPSAPHQTHSRCHVSCTAAAPAPDLEHEGSSVLPEFSLLRGRW